MALIHLLEDYLNGRHDVQYFEALLHALYQEIHHIYQAPLSEADKADYANQVLTIICTMLSTREKNTLNAADVLFNHLKSLK